MIRKRLHRRWVNGDKAMALYRVVKRHRVTWVDRYHGRHVARYGDSDGPWHARPLNRFMLWLSDWQTTWRVRP